MSSPTCPVCGNPRPRLSLACSHCGSRYVRRSMSVTIPMRAGVGYELVTPGPGFRKRRAREALDIVAPGRDGRWVRKYREIDRKNDRYVERVVDVATGEVLRDVAEPLSRHRRDAASTNSAEHGARRRKDQEQE